MGGEKAAKHTSSPFVWKDSDDFIGGHDDVIAYLKKTFMASGPAKSEQSVTHSNDQDDGKEYDYDLVVIGGGSGGLAASKEAARLGAKVAVLDYVKPSPQGTTWGLGGTCVNVGCIPKKLFHQSALIGDVLHQDAKSFGWTEAAKNVTGTHQWDELTQSVQDYIRGLNFKYRVELREKNVKYENFLGEFVDAHTLKLTNPKKNKEKTVTARRIIVAVGGRPKALNIPGGEHAITSDDIFQLEKAPGKTLAVGASYVSLEVAGVLAELGYDTTVMVRSIVLRGFDRDMANRINDYMHSKENLQLIHQCQPDKIEKQEDGRLKVYYTDNGEAKTEIYDTVFAATGRSADVAGLNLDAAGVKLNPASGKIAVKNEQTNVPHIYAIGDVIDCPELTPVAIQAGQYLARRLYGGSTKPMDYQNIPTAVFTPLEYGTVGLSEEDAFESIGEANVEIYHQEFTPLEWALSREASSGYTKLICDKKDDMRVVGFHYLGPNAGEITQAVGTAVKLRATLDDFLDTVGIHPTTAEVFTTLSVTKSSGEDAAAGGC